MKIVHYTDPGCPYAFSAEPMRLRLAWVFGSQLEWDTCLIVLARTPDHYAQKGLTPTIMAQALETLASTHNMPIDVTPRSRLAATEPACLAVVATRTHLPERVDPLLRALRVRAMSGEFLDEQTTIDSAAQDAEIEPELLRTWMNKSGARQALEADRARARSPLPSALAQDDKLATSEDNGRRYTAPSVEFHGNGLTLTAPGFQSWECYNALAANIDPKMDRRAPATDVDEVLTWASYPLATAEIAAIMNTNIMNVRSQLEESNASFIPTGNDGYWTR